MPQFIEVENKIFGPLTWKQFVFMAGGIGLSVVIFLYLPFFFALVLAAPVIIFALALSFYKVNNRTFIDILAAGFSFYTKDRLYLWRREVKPDEVAPEAPAALPAREKLTLSGNRLHDLALSLDIQDKQTEGTLPK